MVLLMLGRVASAPSMVLASLRRVKGLPESAAAALSSRWISLLVIQHLVFDKESVGHLKFSVLNVRDIR